MSKCLMPMGLLALLLSATSTWASNIYGTYQATDSHTCSDPSCATYTDVLTGSGWNSVQGASNFKATITEDSNNAPNANFTPGPFVMSNSSGTLTGILDLVWDKGIHPPAFRLTGTLDFTGGTGAYASFSGETDNLFGSGLFTGPTSAEGSFTFAPEPATWTLIGLAATALGLGRLPARRRC